jgi:hypothetical protein
MSEHPTVAELIREMRMIAIVAGQASVEGPRDFLARQAEAEAVRASRWADALERASSLAPVAPDLPEFCICAAIELATGELFRGHRHDDAIHAAFKAGVAKAEIYEAVHGFMTSRNRFVGREEGARLQIASGIPSASTGEALSPSLTSETMLFSEDLYLRSTKGQILAARDRVAPPSGAQNDEDGYAPANDLPHQGGQDLRVSGGDGSARTALESLLADYHDAIERDDREWFWVDQVEDRIKASR